MYFEAFLWFFHDYPFMRYQAVVQNIDLQKIKALCWEDCVLNLITLKRATEREDIRLMERRE